MTPFKTILLCKTIIQSSSKEHVFYVVKHAISYHDGYNYISLAYFYGNENIHENSNILRVKLKTIRITFSKIDRKSD